MQVNEAIEFLNKLDNQEQQIAMMVVLEDEVKELSGPRISREKLERVTNLISRRPRKPDLNHNYWWENREVFSILVEKALHHVEIEEEKERIAEANRKLANELDLGYNICGGFSFEIRPLRKLGAELTLDEADDPDTIVVKSHCDEFEVPADMTFAELLKMVDTEERSRPFLEEMRYTHLDTENKTATLYLGWGS